MDELNQNEWTIDNLPNRLTIFRVVLIPLVVTPLILSSSPNHFLSNYHDYFGLFSAIIFMIASFTDFLDGYIARKRDLVTVFGSFLDPIADKFLIVSSLIALQGLDRVPAVIVMILVLREMYITSLRLLAKERGLSVPVGVLGKWKTATQMVSIPLLMIYETKWGIPFGMLGLISIYLASLFSVYSALEYSLGLIKKIKDKRKSKRNNL